MFHNQKSKVSHPVLSEASLTIRRQTISFWHPWQVISNWLYVHKGKRGLTCWGWGI